MVRAILRCLFVKLLLNLNFRKFSALLSLLSIHSDLRLISTPGTPGKNWRRKKCCFCTSPQGIMFNFRYRSKKELEGETGLQLHFLFCLDDHYNFYALLQSSSQFARIIFTKTVSALLSERGSLI